MTHLAYRDGPLDTALTGTVYPLSPGQVAPLSIRKNEWRGLGWYQLVAPKPKSVTQFTPYLEWREAK